jgi:hypothetical protein
MQRDNQIAFPVVHLPSQSINQLPVKVGVQIRTKQSTRSLQNKYLLHTHTYTNKN